MSAASSPPTATSIVAHRGDAVTLTFAEEVDVSRGDILASAAKTAPSVADQIAARIVWFDEEPMLPGRSYGIKCGCQTTTATISSLKYKLNVDNLDHVAGKTLELNEVGLCNLSTVKPLVFDPYADNAETGSFILIDRFTNATVAAGMIEFGLRRATNIQWQALSVDKGARANLKSQQPCVLWFTGLSGSGKSTIANMLEKRLHALGRHTYVLDGDNIRHGLNKDLGFTDADRVENIRRVAETAKLFVEAGLIVMVSFISPFRSERRMARELFQDGEFIEVYVDTPLEVCEARDPKGLYRKARAGLISNFTGIDSDYEVPEQAELSLKTSETSGRSADRHLCSQSCGADTWCRFRCEFREIVLGRSRRSPRLVPRKAAAAHLKLVRETSEDSRSLRGLGAAGLGSALGRAPRAGVFAVFDRTHGLRHQQRGINGNKGICWRDVAECCGPFQVFGDWLLEFRLDTDDETLAGLRQKAVAKRIDFKRVVAGRSALHGQGQLAEILILDEPRATGIALAGGEFCRIRKPAQQEIRRLALRQKRR